MTGSACILQEAVSPEAVFGIRSRRSTSGLRSTTPAGSARPAARHQISSKITLNLPRPNGAVGKRASLEPLLERVTALSLICFVTLDAAEWSTKGAPAKVVWSAE